MISVEEAVRHAQKPLARDLITFTPKTLLGKGLQKAFPYLPHELSLELIELIGQIGIFESQLALVHNVFEGFDRAGRPVWTPFDLGVVSRKVITDAGVAYIVDAWQNSVELENMKYHGIGTGTTAEVASQTALVTESTTALNPDSTRATGSLTEGASANIFRTVGTNLVDASVSCAEHGIFNQAATGGGTMFDRSTFTAVALAPGDSLQSTYDATFTSGG